MYSDHIQAEIQDCRTRINERPMINGLGRSSRQRSSSKEVPGISMNFKHGHIIGSSRGRWEELDGIRGGDLALEVLKQRLTVNECDGGNLLSSGDLNVLGVLKLVVFDVEDEGFERVEVPLLGAVGGLRRAGEGVIGAEAELITHPDDPVEFATDREVTKGGERVHHVGWCCTG